MIIHKSSSNSNSSSIITNMTYQRINLHQITCLFLVLVVTLHHHVTYTYSKPCRTDWSDLDLHQLDYEWNQNDDDDDDDDDKIKTPDQEFFEINEAHRQKAQSLLKQHAQGDIHLNSNRLIELQHAGTPAMIFAHLRKTSTTKSKSKSKSKWTWDELSEICQEWGYRLNFVPIDIQCYPIEPDRILVTVQKSWFGRDVFDFLTEQSSILEQIQWNDQTVKLNDVCQG